MNKRIIRCRLSTLINLTTIIMIIFTLINTISYTLDLPKGLMVLSSLLKLLKATFNLNYTPSNLSIKNPLKHFV
jgi:hypothetical protein